MMHKQQRQIQRGSIGSLLALTTLALAGCGTKTVYSVESEGDIDEIHVACDGPIGAANINFAGKPILKISAIREEESTAIYLAKHDSSVGQAASFPSSITFVVSGDRTAVEKEPNTGDESQDAAVYRYRDQLNSFSVEIGSLLLGQAAIEIEPMVFNYEKRRYLRCLQ